MRRRTLVLASTLGAGIVALLVRILPVAAGPATDASPATRAPPVREGDVPVLVELFTSEGCSSCPPADRIASELLSSQAVPGARIIVLAQHVDYWNDLGWPDPFSSRAASARQRAYAPLGGGSYTPQVVIDGVAQMVGSHRSSIEQAVATASKRPHAKLELDVTVAPPARGVFDVTVRLTALPAGTETDAELVLAVVQDRAEIAVPRGENAGRRLEHVAVARRVTALGRGSNPERRARTVVHLPALIGAPDGSTFSVVAFAQEPASRRVIGTATAPLPAR